ncbi:MAG: NADH-quinone oxidoreductase subunit J [Burkholderia sp.]|nr:NADH-quinone oxidoreductase subunit J [Burkholderia sp.]
MGFTTILFYILASILIISGLRVIGSSNPVVATLFLVLAFFNAAMIWMLLEAEFLSIILVLVYVGAVMVLFLFVVMMIDIEKTVFMQHDFKRFLPMATFIGAIIAVESGLVLWHSYGMIKSPVRNISSNMIAGISNTRLIGKVIYTDYIFGFEIVGFILLTAIVAASALILPNQSKDSKRQCVSEQIGIRAQDRIRIVKYEKNKSL